MKSGKQRRQEIMSQRRERMRKLAFTDVYAMPEMLDPGAVIADHAHLAHNNSYLLPVFYMDRAYVCRDCGAHQVWTAKQQKWWYEVAHGNINSMAVRCRSCRKREQARKAEARRVYYEGLERKLAAATSAAK